MCTVRHKVLLPTTIYRQSSLHEVTYALSCIILFTLYSGLDRVDFTIVALLSMFTQLVLLLALRQKARK